jgi:hypothetical protein
MAEIDQPVPQTPLASYGIPMVYFNGFNVGTTGADVGCILMYDNQPALRTVMSVSAAKSLSQALALIVRKFEEATSTTVVTLEDMKQFMDNMK